MTTLAQLVVKETISDEDVASYIEESIPQIEFIKKLPSRDKQTTNEYEDDNRLFDKIADENNQLISKLRSGEELSNEEKKSLITTLKMALMIISSTTSEEGYKNSSKGIVDYIHKLEG